MEDLKMMKKIWKNRSGVSPVIATILMVAITVVLAAVLYVMVMGFGGSTPQAPAATLTKSGSDKVIVNINPATDLGDMRFSFGATAVAMNDAGETANGLTVAFVDVGGDGKVTSGDYFTISGTKTSASTTTPLSLMWASGDTTQSLVSLDI
jgi:archaeal type IV pilus assembly protein PilA